MSFTYSSENKYNQSNYHAGFTFDTVQYLAIRCSSYVCFRNFFISTTLRSIQAIVIILKSEVIKIITKSMETKILHHSETMHTQYMTTGNVQKNSVVISSNMLFPFRNQ